MTGRRLLAATIVFRTAGRRRAILLTLVVMSGMALLASPRDSSGANRSEAVGPAGSARCRSRAAAAAQHSRELAR